MEEFFQCLVVFGICPLQYISKKETISYKNTLILLRLIYCMQPLPELFENYTAFPWQNRQTDIFDKIEFLPLIGSECQYLPMENIKHISLQF